MTTNSLTVSTVTEAAYQHIRDLILTGYFSPGQWLRERELTDLLGVSRTPIREALRLLEQDRLVISASRKGFRIPVPTAKDITDFYELRSELEGFAAAKAARKADAGRLSAIEAGLKSAQMALDKDDMSEVIALNNQFHDMVAAASGNDTLYSVLNKLRTNVNLFRVLSWSGHRERPATTVHQHRLIFQAIQSRNETLARARAMDHIMDSLPLALAGLQSIAKED